MNLQKTKVRFGRLPTTSSLETERVYSGSSR